MGSSYKKDYYSVPGKQNVDSLRLKTSARSPDMGQIQTAELHAHDSTQCSLSFACSEWDADMGGESAIGVLTFY